MITAVKFTIYAWKGKHPYVRAMVIILSLDRLNFKAYGSISSAFFIDWLLANDYTLA